MTDLRTLYGEYIAALNDRRLSEMDRFAHERLTFNGEPVSRADYVATISAHLDCVPDFRWKVEDLIVEDDRVAARLVDTGTPRKAWLGLEPTGASVRFTEYAFYRFRDRRFFDMWYLLDLASIRDQLERRAG